MFIRDFFLAFVEVERYHKVRNRYSRKQKNMAVVAKDIAQKLGVSVATVSRALKGRNDIGKDTRRKVKVLADKLGYKPNVFAKALVTGKTGVLGVAVRDISYLSDPYFGAVLGGIACVCDENGMSLSVVRSISANSHDPECIISAREGRYDGLIILDQCVNPKDVEVIADMGMPIVVLNNRIKKLPTVRIDYRSITRQATSYLIGKGHKKIAVLMKPETTNEFREKLAGHIEALEEANLPVDPDLIKKKSSEEKECDFLKKSIHQLERLDEPPTVLFCFRNSKAANIYQTMQHMNSALVGKVHIVYFDDDMVGEKNSIDSMVEIPCQELGISAANLLLGMLNGKNATREIVLEGEFVPGQGIQMKL